jgi:DNA adenine methylase
MAKKIISYFPDEIDIYYEPFIGGGSVFFELLRSNKKVKSYELSDINLSLIEIFKIVQNEPQKLIESYRDKWIKLKNDSKFYYLERDIFNETSDPYSFYFLTRTCYNGTIRFNKSGKFNVSHHFGRDGMSPDKIEKIINYYHNLMKGSDIKFINRSYEKVVLNKGGVVYLDPPYTNSNALYNGNIDFDNFKNWIELFGSSWFLNINGVNSTDNEENINIDYDEKVLLKSGNSSFSRMKKQIVDVGEYFYYKIQ